MARQRIINTRFWDDSYIAGLSPNEKLVFLYLLTSPLTNIAGVYELSVRRASFDTALAEAEVQDILARFESDKKIVRSDGWTGIVNFIRYQTLNPKVVKGIAIELGKAPEELVKQLKVEWFYVRYEKYLGSQNVGPDTGREVGESIRRLAGSMRIG